MGTEVIRIRSQAMRARSIWIIRLLHCSCLFPRTETTIRAQPTARKVAFVNRMVSMSTKCSVYYTCTWVITDTVCKRKFPWLFDYVVIGLRANPISPAHWLWLFLCIDSLARPRFGFELKKAHTQGKQLGHLHLQLQPSFPKWQTTSQSQRSVYVSGKYGYGVVNRGKSSPRTT